MSHQIGMDPDEVDGLATEFDIRATEIDELRTAIHGELESSVWTGPDHDRFQIEWDTTLAPAVSQASDALRAAAQTASSNAAHQRLASGAA